MSTCKMNTRSSGIPGASKGRKRSCGALIHDADKEAPLISIKRGKRISQATLNLLYSHDPPIISQTAGFICNTCLQTFEASNNIHKSQLIPVSTEGLPGPADSESSEESSSHTMAGTPQEANTTSGNDNTSVAGKEFETFSFENFQESIHDDIYNVLLKGEKTDVSTLAMYKASEWLKDRPRMLVTHLSGLLGHTYEDIFQNERTAVKVAQLVESIYSSRNSRLVLPLSFRENMLIYNLSGSKLLVNYNGSVSAGGSYSYLMNNLKEAGTTPLGVPEGIVRVVIDNEQVVGKRYKVGLNNKVPVSVVTSKIYISINEQDSLQSEVTDKPSGWMFTEPTDNQRLHMTTLSEEENELFRESRNDLLSSRLIAITQERKSGKDYIDDLVTEVEMSRQEKVCSKCGADNAATSRLCTNCKGVLLKKDVDFAKLNCDTKGINPYEHLEYTVSSESNKCRVAIGEPVLMSPNSYENIANILRGIGMEAGIYRYGGQLRHWIYMECDGGIYPIIIQLILNVLLCNNCKKSFYGHETFIEHRCSVLHSIEPQHEFDWIVILPGLLHVEMNATRAIFELCWEPFMKDVAQVLGFTSQRAQEYAKKGSDHHKSWQMIEIMYFALTDELLVPFLDYCDTKSINPNVHLYWEFCSSIKDPNYSFVQQIALTFLHSLMLFRDGVRKGNSKVIETAKGRMAPIFFGRNHPSYRKIITQDKFIMEMMPPKVKEIARKSLSLSRTGAVGHYQGGDACLEEVNKDAKSWIPPGVPTNTQWQRIFRNLETLKQIRHKTLSDASLCDASDEKENQSSTTRFVSHSEYAAVRVLFRQHKYLLSPKIERDHTCLKGDITLSNSLRNFTVKSVEAMNAYITGYLNKEPVDIKPVYLTLDEERQKEAVNNCTKDQLCKKIFELLEKLDDAGLLEDTFQRSIRHKSKTEYIAFYHEIVEKVKACSSDPRDSPE